MRILILQSLSVCSDKVEKVLNIVEHMQEKNDLVEKISAFFECMICRDVMKRPQYSPCCHRLIGCQSCVTQWFARHTLCPHCSSPSQLSTYTDLRGIDA